jgi:hypothetical protein
MSRAFGAASAAAFIEPNVSSHHIRHVELRVWELFAFTTVSERTPGAVRIGLAYRIAWDCVSTRRGRRCFTVRDNA